MRPNRQELQGQIVAGPSFTPVDTFAAPPQRAVQQQQQLDLQGLIDISDTLRGVRAAEAKQELAFEKELSQEFARRQLEGESFGSIIKDLLGTEGTPNQTKAKLVRMQRDGRISATESPVFLSLVDDAKVELLAQRAGEAVNRRATDIVKAGRAAAAQYAGAEDVDLKVQEAIAAAVDEIIADEVGKAGDRRSTAMRVGIAGGTPLDQAGSETPGLGDRAARRLAGTLDTLASDLEVKAYIMLQEEMEDDLLTSKTEVSAKQAMDIVEALNDVESHSFSANDRGPLREQLQKDLMVYADSGKKDYHAAFEDGPLRTYVNAFRQIADPSEREEALEGLMQIATELTGPGGVKPYSGATKRANRVSTMIQKEIRESRRAARADAEIGAAVQVEKYVAEKVDTELLLVDPANLTAEEMRQLHKVILDAEPGMRAKVANYIEGMGIRLRNLGPSDAATPAQEAAFTRLAGEGGELSVFGDKRAELQELFERSPEALTQTLIRTEGLTPLQAARVTNQVRGFKREALAEASKWRSTANAIVKSIEEGRPIQIDAEGGLLDLGQEAQSVPDRQFAIDLRNELTPQIDELEQQIERGEIDSARAVRQFQAKVNERITARQVELETDEKILTTQELIEVERTQSSRALNSASQVLYGKPDVQIPDKPLNQIPSSFAVSGGTDGGRQDRARRVLALGALYGFDNVEELQEGDKETALQRSRQSAEEIEAQATTFANSLMLELLEGDYRQVGVHGSAVQALFEDRFRQALGLYDLPDSTGLSESERTGLSFKPGADFENLYRRMAESSDLFSLEDGRLQVDYTRLSLPRLFTIDSALVDDTELFNMGVASRETTVAPKRQFQDYMRYASKSLEDLNIGGKMPLEEYANNPFDDEAFTRLVKGNPVWAYTKKVADALYETKTGAAYNSDKKADRMQYGIVVAHVYDQLKLLNQTIE